MKVRTNFGMIGIPVGSYHSMTFHLNVLKNKYILLNAYSSLLDGKLEHDVLEEIAGDLAQIQDQGSTVRKLLGGYINVAAYFMMGLTFLLFLILLILLTKVDGSYYGELFIVYFILLFISILGLYYGKYAYTNILRRNYREAELFLRKINYQFRSKDIFFVLGKNLLWFELHLLSLTSSPSNNDDIEVNLSMAYKNPKEAAVEGMKIDSEKFQKKFVEVNINENLAMTKLKQDKQQMMNSEIMKSKSLKKDVEANQESALKNKEEEEQLKLMNKL